MAIRGIDISDNQGAVDWPTCAASVLPTEPNFIVAVKVNEEDYESTQFHQQRMGAHAAGVKWVILYDFARFDLCSGRAEAERFVGDVGNNGGFLPNEGIALDLEVLAKRPDLSNADLRAYVLDWLQVPCPIQSPPFKLFLYSSVEQLKAFHMFEEPSPLHDPRIKLWLVNLGGTTAPAVPFGDVVMIQNSWSTTIAGIATPVDGDLFLGSVDDLKAMTWGNQPDPLGGKLIAGTPDIAVNDKGEATDVTAAAQAIARDVELARRLYGMRGTPEDTLLATAQGDAAAIALRAGLQG